MYVLQTPTTAVADWRVGAFSDSVSMDGSCMHVLQPPFLCVDR